MFTTTFHAPLMSPSLVCDVLQVVVGTQQQAELGNTVDFVSYHQLCSSRLTRPPHVYIDSHPLDLMMKEVEDEVAARSSLSCHHHTHYTYHTQPHPTTTNHTQPYPTTPTTLTMLTILTITTLTMPTACRAQCVEPPVRPSLVKQRRRKPPPASLLPDGVESVLRLSCHLLTFCALSPTSIHALLPSCPPPPSSCLSTAS